MPGDWIDQTNSVLWIMKMVLTGAVMAVMALAQPAAAQPAPDYDFQWATIGDVGNPGYTGPTAPGSTFPIGRGAVGYEYRISKLEVTTAQWMEYVNTFTTQSDDLGFNFRPPLIWGAESDLSYDGPGMRYQLQTNPRLTNPAMQPVAGISWRDAARYCNWLHNGKSAALSSLDTGAYDTSTWGPGTEPGTFTDGDRHLPGARFWIPTLDEWLKAAHFDPAGNNGVGRWWHATDRSDTQPTSGRPGIGESSVGTEDWAIPLGSYPATQSAYGLLDLSGGAREWMEDWGSQVDGRYSRLLDGTSVFDTDIFTGEPAMFSLDWAWRRGGDAPTGASFATGLRIASIPCPSMILWVGLGWAIQMRRRACAQIIR